MTKDKKSYYAVIPANIRYDESLPPNAKLLYGEITALCNAEGYCWASNKYFADLYGVTTRTASKWVNDLIGRGYIQAEVFYNKGSKEIEKRYITISPYPIEENFHTYGKNLPYPIEENFHTPHEKNFQENNTDINNTVNKKEIYKEKSDKPTRTRFIPPTVEEVKAYCKERNNGVDAERFVNYYTSNGWKVGKNKMQDWKSAVRSWEKNDIPNKPGKKKSYLTGKTGDSTFDVEEFAKWDFENTYGGKQE